MQNIGIQILLRHGAMIPLTLTWTEAKHLVDGFRNGSLTGVIGGVTADNGIEWAVRVDDVSAIVFSSKLAAPVVPQSLQRDPNNQWGLSGGRN